MSATRTLPFVNLTEKLHTTARGAGASGSGVCVADPFGAVADTMRARIANGMSAGLGFTFGDPDTATDVRKSFPWASHLFVVAFAYLPEAGSPERAPGRGRIARFATTDHCAGLVRILEAVVSDLRHAGNRVERLHDDNRLVDRAAAVRAGVGWWGKNTMVLAPGVGPWILLGTVVTDAALEASLPMRRTCGTCAACMPACPTGALVAPGVLDARRCLAHWLQAPGLIPHGLREAIEDRIYGCDDCIEACPPGERLVERSPGRAGDIDLYELLALDDASLLAQHAHFFVPGRRARYLRSNALIALGNSFDDRAVPLLAEFVGHPDWLLRAYAAWALGRIGGPVARAVIEFALRREIDERVVAELDLAGARHGTG